MARSNMFANMENQFEFCDTEEITERRNLWQRLKKAYGHLSATTGLTVYFWALEKEPIILKFSFEYIAPTEWVFVNSFLSESE